MLFPLDVSSLSQCPLYIRTRITSVTSDPIMDGSESADRGFFLCRGEPAGLMSILYRTKYWSCLLVQILTTQRAGNFY